MIGIAALLQLVVVEPSSEPQPAPPPVKLELHGLIQVEAGARPDPGDTPGFRVSRARLSVDGKLEKTLALEGYVELELSPTSRLLEAPLADAWIGMDVASKLIADLGRLRIGQMKTTFGGELQRAPETLVFIDRAAPLTCLAPGRQDFGDHLGDSTGRDIGLRWDGGFGPLELSGGVWNGEGPNRVRAPDPAPHAGPLVTARAALVLGPDDPAHAHLVVGGSFANGDSAPLAHCAGAPITRADLTWAAGDLYFRWKWLRAESEYVWREGDWGLSGTGALYAIPDFLMVAFRAERVPDFWQWTAGLSLQYFGERFRLQYGYTRRMAPAQTTSAHLLAFTLAL